MKCAITKCERSTRTDVVFLTLGLCEDCYNLYHTTPHQTIKEFVEDMNKTQAVKHDEGKVRLDLIHPIFVEQLGQALTYGAKKYGDTNYLKGGLSYLRLFGSLLRHLFAWARREDTDPESGLPHLAHAAGALMMLAVVVDKKLGEDDRL